MTAAATHGSLILQVNLRDVAGEPYLADYTAAQGWRRPTAVVNISRSSRSENRSGSADSTRKAYGAAALAALGSSYRVLEVRDYCCKHLVDTGRVGGIIRGTIGCLGDPHEHLEVGLGPVGNGKHAHWMVALLSA